MGKKKYASVNFDVKIVPQEKINNEFTLCKCYAFGLGKNRNYSHISKENMERCKSTLSYAPVVGHLMEKYDKDGNVIAYSHDDIFQDFSSACIDAQKNVDKYPNIAYMEIRDRNDQK